MNKSIIGIVDSDEDARSILGDLRRIGFGPAEVSVLVADRNDPRGFTYRYSTKAPEVALLGSGAGALLGVALGLAASLDVLALPGSETFMLAGPLLAALSCGAAVAAIGGVAGALAGRNIPEIEARRCDRSDAHGSILIAVHVDNHDAELITESVLTRGGAHDVVRTHEAPVPVRH